MPVEWVEKLVRAAHVAGARLVVRSALNPLLWLCGVLCPLCWAAAYALRADVPTMRFLVGLAAVPVLTTCGIAVYLAVRKPDRLQSEEFQIRQQTLRLLRQKGRRLKADPALLAEVMKPIDPRGGP